MASPEASDHREGSGRLRCIDRERTNGAVASAKRKRPDLHGRGDRGRVGNERLVAEALVGLTLIR
jgi:hypothetical protein